MTVAGVVPQDMYSPASEGLDSLCAVGEDLSTFDSPRLISVPPSVAYCCAHRLASAVTLRFKVVIMLLSMVFITKLLAYKLIRV